MQTQYLRIFTWIFMHIFFCQCEQFRWEVHNFCSWYLGVNFLIYRTLGFLFLLHRQQLYQGFDGHALWNIGEEERACYHSNQLHWWSKWVQRKPHFYHLMHILSSRSKHDTAIFVTLVPMKLTEKNWYIGPSCMFKSQFRPFILINRVDLIELRGIICLLNVKIFAEINRNKISS